MKIPKRIASLTEQVGATYGIAQTILDRELVCLAEVEILHGLFQLAFLAMHDIEIAGKPSEFDDDWREMRQRLAYIATEFSRALATHSLSAEREDD